MRITEAADLVAPEEELPRSLANDLFSYYIRRVVAVVGFLSRFSARIQSPFSSMAAQSSAALNHNRKYPSPVTGFTSRAHRNREDKYRCRRRRRRFRGAVVAEERRS